MLHVPVFDMYVNAGSHAVKVLQRTLILFDIDITVDGVIGPITIAATQTAARRAPDHLVDAYGIERVNCYRSLADARPNLRKVVRTRRGNKGGWIKRAEKYMRPLFHLSPSVFQQRTAAWG
jgi:lysozyme family protein